MIRKNKTTIIITSILTVLPIVVGLILWNDLPERIAIHFGVDNSPNGWASRGFAVFGLPITILAIYWLGIIAVEFDSKKKNISGKILRFIFWIFPIISLTISVVTYAFAMGAELNIGLICKLLIGILFIGIGNYLPKCKPNKTVGIRWKYTLNDHEIWRKTHRVAGFSFTVCGVLMLVTAFLNTVWLFISCLILSGTVPYAYSYINYKKHK